MRSIRPDDACITGRGLVTALAFGLDPTFRALCAGRTAVGPVGDADPAAACAQAAIVQEPYLRANVPPELEPQIKFLNGAGELAVEAANEAAQEARLDASGVDPAMRGLYLSQMDSGDWCCPEFRTAVAVATEEYSLPLEAGSLNQVAARRVKPFFMLESLKNNAFSFLATMFELRGANTSVAGFAGPTHEMLGLAARSLARGDLDVAFVVGAARPSSATARVEMELRGFTRASSDGTVCNAPGDGAAALVLERFDAARARGVEPHAALLGHATATLPPLESTWAPTAQALRDAAARALDEAEVETGDLLGVVVPGVGEAGLEETLATLPALAGVPRVSWKRQTGHMALASDATEAALVSRSLGSGRLPGAAAAGESGRGVLLLTAGFLGQAGGIVLSTAGRRSTGGSA